MPTQPCVTCGGRGRGTCPACVGFGFHTHNTTRTRWDGSAEHGTERVPCGGCGGSGRASCPACGGTGTAPGSDLSALANTTPRDPEETDAMSPAPSGGAPGYGPLAPAPFEMIQNIYYEHPQDHRVRLVFLAGTSQIQLLMPMTPEVRFNAPQLPDGQWVRLQGAEGRPLPLQVCRSGWRLFAEWRSLDDTAPPAPTQDANNPTGAGNAGAVVAAAVAVGALAVTGVVAAVKGVRNWFGKRSATGGPKDGGEPPPDPPAPEADPPEGSPPAGPAPT